jgi:hypothetical protein
MALLRWIPALAVGVGLTIGVLLVAWSEPARPGMDCASGGLGGAPPALGSPAEGSAGSTHWYNFSVQAGGGGIRLGDLGFRVQSMDGTPISPTAAWGLSVSNASGAVVGSYLWTGPHAGSWPSGATTPFLSGLTVSLQTSPAAVSNDLLVMTIASAPPNGCPVQGVLDVNIP